MKKLVALACVAALTLTAAPVFANPSISNVTNEVKEIEINTEDTFTTVALPEDDKVVVKPAEPAKYEELGFTEIKEVVEKLLDAEKVYTTVEILETAGIELTEENEAGEVVKKEYKTTEGNPVDPEKLDPITYMSNFEFEKSGELLEDGSILATIPGSEVLKGEKKERVIIVQFDLEQYTKKMNGEDVELTPYFVEVEEILEDGTITAKFPCTGPFFITINTDVPVEE